MQSTASSAGYSTGGTLISAFAAYMLLNPDAPLSIPLTLGWVFFLAVLGVTMAIPMKRQMVNIEQLRFPSGIAAAETLRALHSHGEKGCVPRALGHRRRPGRGQSVLEGRTWALIHSRSGPFSGDRALVKRFNKAVVGQGLDGSHGHVRLGSGLHCRRCADGHADIGQHAAGRHFMLGRVRPDPATSTEYHRWQGRTERVVQWTLWGGVSCMITSGLLSVRLAVAKRAAGLRQSRKAVFAREPGKPTSEMDDIEVPASWFIAGQLVGLIGLARLAKLSLACPSGRVCGGPAHLYVWPWWLAALRAKPTRRRSAPWARSRSFIFGGP